MTPPLLLREFGPPVVAQLTESEATALQQCAAGLDVRLTRQPGMYELRASQFVGTVVLPTRTVRIAPKVPVERLVYLLGFAPELAQSFTAAHGSQVDDVVSAMKAIYSHVLQKLLLRGLLREYRLDEDDSIAVRGRIDVMNLALRRFGMFPPLRCRYQEYTIDREENRRLLAAAIGLAKAGDRRDRASRTLADLIARFDGVTPTRYDASKVKPLRRDRLVAHYDPALAVAESVLQNASLELAAANANAIAFVVDMNKVYERFVARALMGALDLEPSKEWRMQPYGLFLDRAAKIPMRPDILWRDENGHPLVVIDTKYKKEDRATPQDVQQVVAYCSALGLRDAVLLYAESPEAEHVINTSGIRVRQWRLSLRGTTDDLQREIDRVAASLRELLNRLTPAAVAI
jgi:5-methylcytosine-specific restriction enzyme subunit McrC